MTTDAAGNEFLPSPRVAAAPDGRRDVGLVFIGASFVVGVGDPKGQGWVGRVVGRSQHPELDLTAYNLGIRGDTSGDVLKRWQVECPPRWAGRGEKRLVISVGLGDIFSGVTLARHRLNLANILDESANTGVATFVVSPPPTADAETNAKLEVLVEAQADVCARRMVPFVDTYRPLLGHDQWKSELASSRDGVHPGQAGYGLMAWLVLHNGWTDWLHI